MIPFYGCVDFPVFSVFYTRKEKSETLSAKSKNQIFTFKTQTLSKPHQAVTTLLKRRSHSVVTVLAAPKEGNRAGYFHPPTKMECGAVARGAGQKVTRGGLILIDGCVVICCCCFKSFCCFKGQKVRQFFSRNQFSYPLHRVCRAHTVSKSPRAYRAADSAST
jgi:hypothetical protein